MASYAVVTLARIWCHKLFRNSGVHHPYPLKNLLTILESHAFIHEMLIGRFEPVYWILRYLQIILIFCFRLKSRYTHYMHKKEFFKGCRSQYIRLKILPTLRIACNFSCKLGLIYNLKFWPRPKMHHVVSPLGGSKLLRLGKLS